LCEHWGGRGSGSTRALTLSQMFGHAPSLRSSVTISSLPYVHAFIRAVPHFCTIIHTERSHAQQQNSSTRRRFISPIWGCAS
jgi:hypothetical protein